MEGLERRLTLTCLGGHEFFTLTLKWLESCFECAACFGEGPQGLGMQHIWEWAADCWRKSSDAKIVVGELIMLDIVIHLSTDLKFVFHKTRTLCLLCTERKNWNFRQTKLNHCTNWRCIFPFPHSPPSTTILQLLNSGSQPCRYQELFEWNHAWPI